MSIELSVFIRVVKHRYRVFSGLHIFHGPDDRFERYLDSRRCDGVIAFGETLLIVKESARVDTDFLVYARDRYLYVRLNRFFVLWFNGGGIVVGRTGRRTTSAKNGEDKRVRQGQCAGDRISVH